MQKQNKQEQWEIEFDKKFNFYDEYDAGVLDVNEKHFGGDEAKNEVKQFISNLLSQSRQEAVEEYKNKQIQSMLGEGNPAWLIDNANRDLKKAIDKSLSSNEK
jgi:hypothetical protein